jgi:hypothetical protein
MKMNIWKIKTLLGIILVSGCSYNSADLQRGLNSIETPEQEKLVFDRIWNETNVAFISYDESGKEIASTAPDWLENVTTIEFIMFKSPIRHQLLEKDNLFYLIRE